MGVDGKNTGHIFNHHPCVICKSLCDFEELSSLLNKRHKNASLSLFFSRGVFPLDRTDWLLFCEIKSLLEIVVYCIESFSPCPPAGSDRNAIADT